MEELKDEVVDTLMCPKLNPTPHSDVPPEFMMMVSYTPYKVDNQDIIADSEEQSAIENRGTLLQRVSNDSGGNQLIIA
ncbi:hypothetical protein ILUMI_21398 [Ignelater luminosus]|uniref:Uncharacterized protein n=1 Tax=Ignelater luminosus TaxID=2038154 RepID=A0A8K0G3M6_IGNLU|nr:hypothetical protein ILUMI_21398 [Ignelater luminosus]